MGAASEDAAPTSVAAVYVIADSLAYMGWTAFGLVTGAAFFALREVPAPAWIRWFRLLVTVLFLVCAFLPYPQLGPRAAVAPSRRRGAVVRAGHADRGPGGLLTWVCQRPKTDAHS